ELLLCHGTVCVVGKMRDLILQLSKSSIYSTKPFQVCILPALRCMCVFDVIRTAFFTMLSCWRKDAV
ncbi:MAG: hypothetical protein KH310_25785, partial [Enterobacteriaceae bacterium]|nr:hypothetical protein [Enterobacteriaceae bacterium]